MFQQFCSVISTVSKDSWEHSSSLAQSLLTNMLSHFCFFLSQLKNIFESEDLLFEIGKFGIE